MHHNPWETKDSDEVWVTSSSLNKWITAEEAYLRLSSHWLVRLAVKLKIIKLGDRQ